MSQAAIDHPRQAMQLAPWRVLVVDDDPAVHETTSFVLRDFAVDGRGIHWLHAYSAEEAKSLLAEHPDIALGVIDVVMETDHAGLDLVRHIREQLDNHVIRLIVRTGQPGRATDHQVMLDYQINDYWDKAELTSSRLKISTVSALRAYRDLCALREVCDQVKAEAGSHTEQLRVARDEAQRANRAKSEFLANMSHEIRTPLNGVVGTLGLLVRTPMDPRQLELVANMQLSSRQLLSVIDDVLDFSKIESGRLALEIAPFELRACLEDALQLGGSQSQWKEIELTYHMDVPSRGWFHGDVVRLRQVFVNLISNAVRFTETGGVHVDVCAVNSDDDGVLLECVVRDSGIGIESEQLNRIFDAFAQADASTTRRYGGTGLGLAICTRLVALMGGAIEVKSVPGKGSDFVFHVRLKRAVAGVATRASGPDPAGLAGKHVVICHSYTRLRAMLSAACDDFGMRVHEEDDLIFLGESAALPDVLITDVTALRDPRTIALSNGSELETLPIVALCAAPAAVDADWLRQRSNVQLLSKPVRRSALRHCLENSLRPERGIAAVGPEEPPADAPPQRTMKILVVDDNAMNRSLMNRILQVLGQRPDLVSNGYEALQHLEFRHYEVIFLDLQMPGIDGVRVMQRLCEGIPDPRDRPTVFALTASALAEDRARCLQAGMAAYLTKPVTVEDVQEALSGALVASHAAVETGVASPGGELLSPETVDKLERLNLFTELTGEFSRRMPGYLTQLSSYLGQGDQTAIRRWCHTCKGACLNTGATRLADLFTRMESTPPESAAAARASIKEIKNCLQATLQVMSAQQVGEALTETETGEHDESANC